MSIIIFIRTSLHIITIFQYMLMLHTKFVCLNLFAESVEKFMTDTQQWNKANNNKSPEWPKTRGPQALTVTWASETLLHEFLSEGHIFASQPHYYYYK